MEPKRILCLGRIHFEVLVKRFEYSPPRDIVTRTKEVSIVPGGAGFTTSTILQKLGHNVTVIGCLGEDWQGDTMLSLLESGRLELKIKRIAKPTGVNVLEVDRGGKVRYIVGDAADEQFIEFEPCTAGFDLLHIGNANLFADRYPQVFMNWLERFRELNPSAIVSADATKSPKYARAALDLAPYLDFFLCNEIEARKATEENSLAQMPSHFFNRGLRRALIIKRAEKGVFWQTADGNSDSIPAYTLACDFDRHQVSSGDAFCSGFLDAILDGIEVAQAAEAGNRMAAFQINHQTNLAVSNGWTRPAIESFKPNHTGVRPRPRGSDQGRQFDTHRAISEVSKLAWLNRIRENCHLEPNSLVVDVGCGTGRFAIPIVETFNCRVIGVDKSREWLNIAAEKWQGDPTQVVWKQGNLLDLSDLLAEHRGRVNCIWISSVLEELSNIEREQLFWQCSELLHPDGRLLIRTTFAPLLQRIGLFRFFEKGKSWLEGRLPTLSSLWMGLFECGLLPMKIEFMDDSDQLELPAFLERLRARVYMWTDEYSDEEFETCITNMLQYTTAHNIEVVYDYRPAYFFCVEKLAEAREAPNLRYPCP